MAGKVSKKLLKPPEQLVCDGAYFLIGAGSSRYVSTAYGGPPDFPLGKDLLHEFIAQLSEPLRPDCKSLPERQIKWTKESESRFRSIDELLHQARDEGYDELIECGRRFVDRRIYKAEATAKCRHGNFVVPWVERLMNFVTHGVKSYEEARDRIRPPYQNSRELTFHTLNYDRVVEFSLLNYLSLRFHDRKDRLKILCDIDNEGVRHLHGGLGTLNERPFGEPAKDDKSMVRFWFEKSDKEEDWHIQNTVMKLRSKWIFLGFGFHQQIISRISTADPAVHFYATAARDTDLKNFSDFWKCKNILYHQSRKGDDCCVSLIDSLIGSYSCL